MIRDIKEDLVNRIHAHKKKVTKEGMGNNRLILYWWNERIGELRADAIRARRMTTRAHSRGNIDQRLEEELNSIKKELKMVINVSKKEKWKTLCKDTDEDWAMDTNSWLKV